MPPRTQFYTPTSTVRRREAMAFQQVADTAIWELGAPLREAEIDNLGKLPSFTAGTQDQPQQRQPAPAPAPADDLPITLTSQPSMTERRQEEARQPRPAAPVFQDAPIEQGMGGAPSTDTVSFSAPAPGGAASPPGAPPPVAPASTLGRERAHPHVAPHLSLIEQVAREEEVPADALAALMEVEQSGADSVSPAGARGLMQVVPGQGYDLPGENAADPLTSIRQGARALRDKYRYTGSWEEAGRAYFGYGVDAGGMRTDVYGQRYDAARARYREQAAPAQTPADVSVTPEARVGQPYARNQGEVGNELSLPWARTLEICGPVAAAAFLRKTGRLPGREEAEALRVAQEKGYWQPDRGMGGPASTSQLLTDLGVANRHETGVDWEKVRADTRRGNPVIIDTSGHLFVVETVYDDGTVELGETARFLIASRGRTRYRPDEIASLGMGAPRAAIFLDNPTTPEPSVAAPRVAPVARKVADIELPESVLSAGDQKRARLQSAAGADSLPTLAAPAPGAGVPLSGAGGIGGDGLMMRGPLLPTLGDAFPTSDPFLPGDGGTAPQYPDLGVTGGAAVGAPRYPGGVAVEPEPLGPMMPPPSPYAPGQAESMTPAPNRFDQGLYQPPVVGMGGEPDYAPPTQPTTQTGQLLEGAPGAVRSFADTNERQRQRYMELSEREAMVRNGWKVNPITGVPIHPLTESEQDDLSMLTGAMLPDPASGISKPIRQRLAQEAPPLATALGRAGGVLSEGRAAAARTPAVEGGMYGTLGVTPGDGGGTIGRGGAPMDVKPGRQLSGEWVYHNTRGDYLDAITNEGLSGGSFSERPIDFGGDVWVAVRKSDLPDPQVHDYGGVRAWEPAYETHPGGDSTQFPITQAIPPDKIVLVDRRGRAIRTLGEQGGTAVEPPGGGTTAYGALGAVPDRRPRWVADTRYPGGGFWWKPPARVPDDLRTAQRDAILRNADHLGARRAREVAESQLRRAPDDPEVQSDLMSAIAREEEAKDVADAAREWEQMVRTGDRTLASIGTLPPGDAGGTDRLASVNRVLSQGLASTASGSVAGTFNAQANPDDPNAFATGFAAGAVGPYAATRGARALARRAGAAAPTPGTRLPGVFGVADNPTAEAVARPRVIPPSVVDQLDIPVRIPEDPRAIRAIEAIGGTVDPENGVTFYVTRGQGVAAAGGRATRGSVFYEAVRPGEVSDRFVRPDDPNRVGGSQRIGPAETRFRSPIIVSEPPASSQGFNDAMRQMGNGQEYEAARRAAGDAHFRVLHVERMLGYRSPEAEDARAALGAANDAVARLRGSQGFTATHVDYAVTEARQAGPEGSPARAAALKEVVTRFGGEPDLIDPLLAIRGADASESSWAIRENILSAHARRNGYDGVITVQTREPNSNELWNHPKVAEVRAARTLVGDEFGAIQSQLLDIRQSLADRGISRSDVMSHPEYRPLADRAVELSTEYNRLNTVVYEAEQQARREMSNPKITELADVRESHNPTPGAPNPRVEAARLAFDDAYAAERAAQKASGDAVQEWRRANPGKYNSAEMHQYSQIEATNQALAEAQQRADAARAAYMQVRDTNPLHIGPPGYTLRDDIPRRPDAGGTAARGMVPFDPASAAAGGLAGAATGEEGEDADPMRAAAGAGIGLVGGRVARRGAKSAPDPMRAALPGILRNLNPSAPPATVRGTPGQAAITGLEPQPGTLSRVATAISDVAAPWGNRINILRYAGMLSDTASHVFNTTSGAIMAGVDIAATPIAAGLDVARSAVTRAPREVFFSEVPARLVGMRDGARVGLQDAADIMRTGVRAGDATKMDTGARGFGTDIPGVAPAGSRAAGMADLAVEGPLRALSAADAVFRNMAGGGHLMAEALAAATKANGGKSPTPDMVREAAKNPDLLERVQYLAARSVLQEDRDVTRWIQKHIREAPHGIGTAVSVEIPFVRTPYNVVAQGVGMTPAGLLGLVQDIKQGKAPREMEYRVARVAIGTAVMAVASAEYASGLLTGPRPTEQKEASTLPPGWREWSRKVTVGGQTYYLPLNVLGPLALPAVASILAGEAKKKGKAALSPDWAGQVALGIGRYAEQATFFEGIANMSKMFDERTGEKNLGRNAEQIVSQFSPHIIGGGGLGREIQRIMGMPARDPDGMLDALLATFPYTADRVEPRQDVLGRPASMGASGPGSAVVRAGVERDAGVIRAFRQAGEGLPMQAPKQIPDPALGFARTLTPRQQHQWRRAFGASLEEQWMNRGMPPDVESLKKIEGRARDVAAQTVLGLR